MRWQREHGRHGLPWQRTRDPYRVWLSEIMLQQTRVETAAGYYTRFLQRFPDVRSLAGAPLEDVLRLWAGLGYYARARNAHRCAALVVERGGGRFPASARELQELPGIGASTAAAIAAFCHGERCAILDGNVRRVLARHAGIDGDTARGPARSRLHALAQALLPESRLMGTYTQAIMDLGATVCTRARPRCAECPVRDGCQARALGRIAELPARAAPRARRDRAVHVLVALHRRSVLVEQRPPRGIWGGLLALPEFASRRALQAAAARLGAQAPQAMTARRHAFTHFTLTFTPCIARICAPSRPRPAPGRRWLALSGIERAPLPAPLLSLLRELRAVRRA